MAPDREVPAVGPTTGAAVRAGEDMGQAVRVGLAGAEAVLGMVVVPEVRLLMPWAVLRVEWDTVHAPTAWVRAGMGDQAEMGAAALLRVDSVDRVVALLAMDAADPATNPFIMDAADPAGGLLEVGAANRTAIPLGLQKISRECTLCSPWALLARCIFNYPMTPTSMPASNRSKTIHQFQAWHRMGRRSIAPVPGPISYQSGRGPKRTS